MIERHGVRGTDHDGIFFTEQEIRGPLSHGHISVEVSRQNANLFEVKKRLAAEARARGANAVMNFSYGQRAHSWWSQLFTFRWDSESWYGEGDAVSVSNGGHP